MPNREGSGPASLAPATLLLALLLTTYLTLLVRTAWICDDAYITFRVADNVLNGYGLRWNVADRVQAFTNPLWLLLVTGFHSLTGDVYYTSLALSCAISLLAVWVVVRRIAATPDQAVLAVWILLLSKAFLDYSTSGLENPLSHLLLALFFTLYFQEPLDVRVFARLALLAGLAALNRLDALLLVGPPLLAAATFVPRRAALRAALLGFLPLAGWLAFSLFYYGFALPNTAYAKLYTGIPASQLLRQGAIYLFDSLSLDPLTLVVIALGAGLPFALRWTRGYPVALALALHLAYVVRVGGDFMSGRFLAAPLLIAVILLARAPLLLAIPELLIGAVVIGAVALSGPAPTLTTTAFYFADRAERYGLLDERGVTDERAIYYRYTGLLTTRRGQPMPNHHRALQGRRSRAEGEQVIELGQIGIFGFYAGPKLHIIDSNALGDAFLARLPVAPGWRVGHFGRRFPVGYEGSIRRGTNRLEDPELHALYRKIKLVTRGGLFDSERLMAIWDLNFGEGRHAADDYFAIHKGVKKLSLDELSAPAAGAGDGGQRFSEWGIEVALGRVRHPRVVELGMDVNDVYKLTCLKSGFPVVEREIPASVEVEGRGPVRRAELDRSSARVGCDTLRIVPVSGDQSYSLAFVALNDELGEDELRPAQATPSATPAPKKSLDSPAK